MLRLIEAHDGFYDARRTAQILPGARQDAINTGAVYLTSWSSLLYAYNDNKVLKEGFVYLT